MALTHVNVPPANHVKVLDGQGWVGLIDTLGTETTIVTPRAFRSERSVRKWTNATWRCCIT